MKLAGPLATLVVGGAVATVLLVTSQAGDKSATNTAAAANAASVAPTAQAAEPATAPAAPASADASAAPSAEPAANPTPARASYVGKVAGLDTPIAIAIRDGKAVAYICDGVRVEAWLWGTAADGTLKLASKDGRARLVGVTGNGRSQGTFWLGKRKWAYTATAAKKPSGLYRATAQVRGALYQASWIVDQNGKQTGLLDKDATAGPVPPLTPGTDVTIEGASVTPQDAEDFVEQAY